MNKWMEYQRGLCTDEEYMKYVYNGYIGKVTKNNHDYYIFSNFLGSEKGNYIRDFENGVISGFLSNKDMNKNEVFDFCYNESEDFRNYVDSY